MKKTVFCICENKDTEQLRGNYEADQRLCFPYMESVIPLLAKSKISCHQLSSVVVQPGLCQTWSENPKTGFLTTRLKLCLWQNNLRFSQRKYCPSGIFYSLSRYSFLSDMLHCDSFRLVTSAETLHN